MPSLTPFQRGYLEAALFSSNDESTPEGGEPLEASYTIEDIDPDCLEAMLAEASAFQDAHYLDLGECLRRHDSEGQGGHDLWFTRNRHGVGYWDGDYPEPGASRLTNAAHALGECSLYVANGVIYAAGLEKQVSK